MITGKTLYDSDGNQFYPYSDSEYISSGVVVSSNMLKDDLKAIWAKAQSAYSKASGEETINGQLQIDVYYKNSTESSEENVIAEVENEWNETMTPPDSSAPIVGNVLDIIGLLMILFLHHLKHYMKFVLQHFIPKRKLCMLLLLQ